MTSTLPAYSIPLAFARQIWTRHRSRFFSSLAILAVAAIVYPIVFRISRADIVVILSAIPFFPVFLTTLVAFAMVDDPYNGTPGYPRRMYALPVPTRTLVVWPVVFGLGAIELLWLATAFLVYRPAGIDVPLLWPAVALAAALVCVQALAWAPFASPWVRVFGAAILATVLGTAPAVVAKLPRIHWSLGVLLTGSYIPVAILVALAGVRSDRRGDSWYILPSWLKRGWVISRPAWRRPFHSPAAAQFAYDWRCHGLNLPTIPAALLVVLLVLAPLHRVWPDEPVLPALVPLLFLLPLYTAMMIGPALCGMKPFWITRKGVETFVMTRPLTSGTLAAARFRMAFVSTMLTWTIAVVGVVLWVFLAGAYADATKFGKPLLMYYSTRRIVALGVLGAVVVPGATWTLLTGFLPVGFTNRKWVANTAGGVFCGIFVGGMFVGIGVENYPVYKPLVLDALPWLLGGALLLKWVGAVWAFRTGLSRGLIGVPTVLLALGVWLVLVSAAARLVLLLVPAEASGLLVPVALLLISTVAPLGRFALAPLAMEWGRHL
jgi:hypothetical protein